MRNMKKIQNDKIPEFKTLEDEREYWEARGPLAEGHKGIINKPKAKQKRSSFLAVRLTGEELTQLRDLASKQGVGPSTFARRVLTSAIERPNKVKTITLEQLGELFEYLSPNITQKAEALLKRTAIGDLNNPAMLIIDGNQKKEFEDFSLSFIQALLRLIGIQVITPEKEDYQKLKEIVNIKSDKEEIKI